MALLAIGFPAGGAGRFLALGGLAIAPYFLAVPVAAMSVGEWIHVRILGRSRGPVPAFALGLFILQLVGVIPFVGVLVAVAVGLAGIGGLVMAGRNGAAEREPALPPSLG